MIATRTEHRELARRRRPQRSLTGAAAERIKRVKARLAEALGASPPVETPATIPAGNMSAPPLAPKTNGVRVLAVSPATSFEETVAMVTAALARANHSVVCATCDRQLCRPNRGGRAGAITRAGVPTLSDEDWCRWCARPISARGQQLTPRDGFVAFVRALAHHDHETSELELDAEV